MCGFKDFTMDQDLPSAERFACSLILREIEMPATCSEILEPWQKSLIFGPLAKSCSFVKTRNSGHGRTTVPTVVVGKLSQKRGATPDERNSYSKFPARCSRWNAVENIFGRTAPRVWGHITWNVCLRVNIVYIIHLCSDD